MKVGSQIVVVYGEDTWKKGVLKEMLWRNFL
jgi:hypothetical protein